MTLKMSWIEISDEKGRTQRNSPKDPQRARVWAAELGCKHTFITSMSSVACLCVCVCTTALFHSSSWVHTYRIYLV